MKNLKHRIRVNVQGAPQDKQPIFTGGDRSIRCRLLNRLLGGKIGVLVLVPEGGMVSSVEIHEDTGGGCREAV